MFMTGFRKQDNVYKEGEYHFKCVILLFKTTLVDDLVHLGLLVWCRRKVQY